MAQKMNEEKRGFRDRKYLSDFCHLVKCKEKVAINFIKPSMYSHLSNKRDVTLTDFGKFHPAQNKSPPCTFIDFFTELSIFLQKFQHSCRT